MRPTLIERLNLLLPLPYAVSCLLIAALVGPLGFFVLDVLTTFDVAAALRLMSISASGPYTTLQLLGNNVVYPAIAFYCAFMVRFMRKRIVTIEPELASLSSEWTETVRRSFAGIPRTLPPVLMAGGVTLVLSPLLFFNITSNAGVNQVYLAVSYPIFFFAVATFLWTFACALWGLHVVGSQPLRLRSHKEDPLLGLGILGSTALSLTGVFFVGVFLGALLISAFAADLPLPLFALFLGTLTVAGLVLLFLPLLTVHKRMSDEKEHLRQSVTAEVNAMSQRGTGPPRSTSAEVASDLKRALVLEYAQEDIEALPTWPFDAPLIGRLVLVFLSVAGSIIAHILLVSLNI